MAKKKKQEELVIKGDTLFIMNGDHHLDDIEKKMGNKVKKIVQYGGIVRYKGGMKGKKVRYPYDISVSRGKFVLDEKG